MENFILFILIMLGVTVVISIIFFACTWKLFQLAGEKSWKAAIPFLNFYTQLKIMHRPTWWMILYFVPIVGFIMFIVIQIDFLRLFGKKGTIHTLLGVFFSIFYLGFWNYQKDIKFEGVEERKETLIAALIFAIVFATVIHTFVFQPFTIPTGSMERTLLVGDFLFVNKMSYGARVPMTPVALPFLQNKMSLSTKDPGTKPNSYIDAIRLPYLRFPGYEKVENNKLVVFNYPMDSLHTAIDRKDPYVKRCVGIPGDVIEMKNGKLFINNKLENLPVDNERQSAYYVISKYEFGIEKLESYFGYFVEFSPQGLNENGTYNYIFPGLTPQDAEKLKKISSVISMEEIIEPKGNRISYFNKIEEIANHAQYIFPKDKQGLWNNDNMGPLKIPKKGDVITLNPENIAQYYLIIKNYEGNESFKIEKNQYILNGNPIKTYTIKQNYYWMMGDNRDNSLDSRYFGYVPEDHIMGKPVFIWMSWQGIFDNGSKKLRTERMFKIPNTGIPLKDKTNYGWYILIGLIIYFGWDFFKKKKPEVDKK